MKVKQFKQILGSAFLLTLTFAFSSCEGTLDDIFGVWDRPANGISFDKTEINFTSEGATDQLSVTFNPENTHPKDLTWETKDPSVATVDANGKVTSVDVGVTQITATTANGKTATCNVNVYGVEFETKSTEILAGTTIKLFPTVCPHDATVSWTSSDDTKVSVVGSVENGVAVGKVTAAVGAIGSSYKITASVTVDGKTYTDDITINVVGVTLNLSRVGLYIGGDAVELKATCSGGEAVTTWTNEGDDVVDIIGTGSTITVKSKDAEGIAKIKVTTTNGYTDVCEVVVKELGLPLSEFIAYDMVEFAIGGVLTAEGNVFTSVEKATSLGETPVAMIAYAGDDSGFSEPYTHGLAIALEDESSTHNYLTALSLVYLKDAPTIGSYSAHWYIPTIQSWYYMMYSFGGKSYNCTGLNDALASVGGKKLKAESYWTSTSHAYSVFTYSFNFLEFNSDGSYWVMEEDGFGSLNTRGVIAF